MFPEAFQMFPEAFQVFIGGIPDVPGGISRCSRRHTAAAHTAITCVSIRARRHTSCTSLPSEAFQLEAYQVPSSEAFQMFPEAYQVLPIGGIPVCSHHRRHTRCSHRRHTRCSRRHTSCAAIIGGIPDVLPIGGIPVVLPSSEAYQMCCPSEAY